MKSWKMWMSRYERLFCIGGGLFLALVLAGRLAQAFLAETSFIDLRIMTVTSGLIFNHVSPYGTEAYAAYRFPGPPLQAPSVTFFLWPLLVLPVPVCNVLVYLLSAGAMLAGILLVLHHFRLFRGDGLFSPCYGNLAVWFLVCSGMLSCPVLGVLRAGQLSGIAWLLVILLFLRPRREGWNWLWLGAAASIKYSLLPLAAPILVLQKRWRICAAGFIFFLCFLLLPGLWLDGVAGGFLAYFRMLVEDARGGVNSYAFGSSFGMLQFEFWRVPFLNLAGKLAVLAGYAWMLRNGCRRKPKGESGWFPLCPTVAELAAIGAATLTLSYHRTHDGVLFIPFLVALCAGDWLNRRWREGAVNLGLLLFWFLPLKLIFEVSDRIGGMFPQLGKVIYLSSFRQWQHMFPLSNLMLFAMVFWFFFLALKRQSGPGTPGMPAAGRD